MSKQINSTKCRKLSEDMNCWRIHKKVHAYYLYQSITESKIEAVPLSKTAIGKTYESIESQKNISFENKKRYTKHFKLMFIGEFIGLKIQVSPFQAV